MGKFSLKKQLGSKKVLTPLGGVVEELDSPVLKSSMKEWTCEKCGSPVTATENWQKGCMVYVCNNCNYVGEF